jgi:uncharacterized repeat protein (TIGR04138 family)
MNGKDFSEVVNLIVRKDGRYEKSAYQFIREALDHTVKRLEAESSGGRTRHVGGRELCDGAREYALAQYGPMTATLLRHWGVERTDDFGEIVYNLVDLDVFGTRQEDKREDFNGVYDFHEAFEVPFLPLSRRSNPAQQRQEKSPRK